MDKDIEQKRQRAIGYLMFGEEYDEIDDDLLDVLLRLVGEHDLTITIRKDGRAKNGNRSILKVLKNRKRLLTLHLNPRGRYERDDSWDTKLARKLLEELRNESEHGVDACTETGDAAGDQETTC